MANKLYKPLLIDSVLAAEDLPKQRFISFDGKVSKAGEKYVKPFRKEVDLVLNGNSDLKYFAQILEYIYEITNNFEN